MSKEEKWLWRVAVVAFAAGLTVYALNGCAGPAYDRQITAPGGDAVHETVTPHNIPGTDVPLWHDVEPAPTPDVPAPESHAETTFIGGLVRDAMPYGDYLWPLLILAFKRPRANIIAAAQKAVTGDAGGAIKAAIAMTGLTDTPPDVRLARAEAEAKKAARKSA